jgi:hypothetical protein
MVSMRPSRAWLLLVALLGVHGASAAVAVGDDGGGAGTRLTGAWPGVGGRRMLARATPEERRTSLGPEERTAKALMRRLEREAAPSEHKESKEERRKRVHDEKLIMEHQRKAEDRAEVYSVSAPPAPSTNRDGELGGARAMPLPSLRGSVGVAATAASENAASGATPCTGNSSTGCVAVSC